MRIGKQARRQAKELFRHCQVNGLLEDQHVRQAVQRLIQLKPRGYPAILTHFQRLVRLDLERRRARIESAVPLSPEAQAALQTRLTARYGSGLDFAFSQNPALLGGLRVRVGSDVVDGSVQARLAALEQNL